MVQKGKDKVIPGLVSAVLCCFDKWITVDVYCHLENLDLENLDLVVDCQDNLGLN